MMYWWCLMAIWGALTGLGRAQGWSLRDLMPDAGFVRDMVVVNYSSPNINATYSAHDDFDMRAMGPLYNSTKFIIDIIADKQAYPEGVLIVSDGHVYVAPLGGRWRELLAFYAGPVSLLAVAALVALVMPLAGLFWCCCYWCRSGRRRRPFDRKYDACLKGFLAIVLIGLLTLFLLGVVCVFATEAAVERGAGGLGGAAHAGGNAEGALEMGARDLRTFLNASAAHAHHLLVVNYGELASKLRAAADGGRVALGLAAAGGAGGAVRSLLQVAGQLEAALGDLRAVANLSRELETHAIHLHDSLHTIRWQLIQTLRNCSEKECKQLNDKYDINQLDSTIQYNKMPDVRVLVSRVSELVERDNLTSEVRGAQRVLAALQRDVQHDLARAQPAIDTVITDTGKQLSEMSESISATSARVGGAAEDGAREGGAALRDWHARYGPYRRYLGLATASALLLVMCLLVWGLMCGVCGKRPDVYGASDCCNKGAGSKCLLCGVGVMFAVCGAGALVLAAHFAAGLAAQRLLCDPLTEPRDNRWFADVEKYLDPQREYFYDKDDPDFNLTAILVRCHRNDTIYQVLQLQRVYSLDELEAQVRARADGATVAPVAASARFPPRPATLLSARARELLQRLADTGLSEFNFDRILYALETNVTSLPLDALSLQLRNASAALSRRARFDALATELRAAADALQRAHALHVRPLLDITHTLTETAERLREGLRFNNLSLREAVQFLTEETTKVERTLVDQGPDLMRNMSSELGAEVSALVREYVQRVQHAARAELGRCGPLSAAFNATRDKACRDMLMPLNGYWMSVSWCVVLCVPLCAVCVRLARLYRRLEPYPGPLVEAEYLYDAYADRDNVPLANAYKAEKRGGVRRGAGGEAGGGAGAGPGAGGGGGSAAGAEAALAPAVDAHHARRYHDMAPKHWEEGPPRYHGPTEYERPPPYYYPGPHDRQ